MILPFCKYLPHILFCGPSLVFKFWQMETIVSPLPSQSGQRTVCQLTNVLVPFWSRPLPGPGNRWLVFTVFFLECYVSRIIISSLRRMPTSLRTRHWEHTYCSIGSFDESDQHSGLFFCWVENTWNLPFYPHLSIYCSSVYCDTFDTTDPQNFFLPSKLRWC